MYNNNKLTTIENIVLVKKLFDQKLFDQKSFLIKKLS
jgi:hypothetical protein